MGLKKRSRVSAQFNMSSLTDIIFLLLIFFMLTSSLVAPNALNLKIPGSSQSRKVSTNQIPRVSIYRNGGYALNGVRLDFPALERELAARNRASARQVSIVIDPQRGTPTEYVVKIMDLARRLNINGILAMEE